VFLGGLRLVIKKGEGKKFLISALKIYFNWNLFHESKNWCDKNNRAIKKIINYCFPRLARNERNKK